MKQSLQLKLSQHLALTPQLQQSIRLLQLSTLELEQELEKYLLENPLLEREDENYEPSYSGSEGEYAGSTAEAAAEEILTLPLHPGLADGDLGRVVDETLRAAKE